MAKSFLNRTDLPIGLRNNNPGNLVFTGTSWLGKLLPQQGRFERFIDIYYGIRALTLQLNTYFKRGHNTLSKIMAIYAPTFENPTESYIGYISRKTGFGATQVLQPTTETFQKLIRAIIDFEIGEQYAHHITNSDIQKGMGMASITAMPTPAQSGGILFALGLIGFGFYLKYKNENRQ